MNDPRQRLRDLVAADQAAARGVASEMELICTRCVSELEVSGAGATVLSHTGHTDGCDPSRGLVHASNDVSRGLEDLQLTVGEGPCLDTFDTGGPVLIAELKSEGARWPAFTQEALKLGAAAVFSFPLQIGVVRLGSLDCYRDSPGSLTQDQVTDALVLAELATQAVINELDGHTTDDVGWLADPHTEIHQAAGMVQVQLGASTDVALMRMRGYAYTHHIPLTELARQVVTRELRFPPDDT